MASTVSPEDGLPSPACPRCAAPAPHDHGACAVCCFYTLRRPGAASFMRLPTCLHPTMREERVHQTGTSTVWGDVTVRNGAQTCPTFRRDLEREQRRRASFLQG